MPSNEKSPSVTNEVNRPDAIPPRGDLPDGGKTDALPDIAAHVLIRRIGQGAYGEVWLGRNAIGGLRAIKVVKQSTFPDEGAYQREFKGLRSFDPISRNYAGFVQILQVGENAAAGYFYYVMELADDVETGQRINPDTYVPRTLAHEFAKSGRLPLETSLPIGLALAADLAHLHAHIFIHRDIKPSNIIFVRGVPKLADIGLITEPGENVSACGTWYYMPPEGPGQPTGDIFSLGKVFYGLFMGMPVKRFPDLPAAAEEFTTNPALRQLNNLILKACHNDPAQRFQTAHELHEELVLVNEMVRGRPRSPGAALAVGGAIAGKATATPEGQPTGSGERRSKARWSRRAALLIGVPTAVGGAFFLGKSVTPAEPSNKEKFRKWQVLYDTLDDKLACFMGNVGTVSPSTKFLIYSRGTDKNWVTAGFQAKWVNEIEARFPTLKGRISTMAITKPPGQQYESFNHLETAEEMKERIRRILGLPDRNPTPTPPDSPVLVLMDTTADRGVYDKENKGTPITNAEVLQKQLQNVFDKIYPVTISIESSKRGWHGEQRVLKLNPSLVIIHRSAFFHAVNAELGLGYPIYDQEDRLIGWQP